MEKRIIIGFIVIFVLALGVTAAVLLYPYDPARPPLADDTGSTMEGMQLVADANNHFGFDFYHEVRSGKNDNLFYSPYSISAAFAIVNEGARGTTQSEIREVFYYPDYDVLRPNFAGIYNSMNRRGLKYELRTGNALWVKDDFGLLPDYVNNVEMYYGGRAVNLDFVGDPEGSRNTINSFISDQTNNRINNIMPSGDINPLTRLIITNAVYFKGKWVIQFDKKDTRDEDFSTLTGETVQVPMMRLTGEKARFNYTEDDIVQVIELPYEGDDISMIIILPREGYFDEVEQEFSYERLIEWKDSFRKQRVMVFFPRFKFETDYTLNDFLESMGMPLAFRDGADFTGMYASGGLYVGSALHKAFVEVDEEGTEAAAATVISVMRVSVGPTIPEFRADRPFMFIIQQKETGNILFMGRMSNPLR
ncbi:MAG: serpin family protein [Candidatus Woesearchaeota archaeon]